MAFKTTRTQEIPATQLGRAIQIAAQVRREAVLYRDQAVSGSVRVADLQTGLLSTLVEARAELEIARATPGIKPYAESQFDDPLYDIVAEFTAMVSEIDTTTAWFEANFPTDAMGYLQVWTFVGDGSGAVQSDTITNITKLNALKARLDGLIAAID